MHVEGSGLGERAGEAAIDAARVLQLLRERAPRPLELREIAAAANLPAAADALDELIERGDAIPVARPRAYADAAAARALLTAALATLDEAQRAEPWAMGLTSIALARRLALEESLLVRVLEHFVEKRNLLNRGGYYATLDFEPVLSREQQMFFDSLVPLEPSHPFLPIPFPGVASAVKSAHLAGVNRAFDTLLAQGTFVKVRDDLYRGSQIRRIVARVRAHFEENDAMTAAKFRDLLGTSRKYAVPLLEWLDAHGTTIRNGDHRRLRKEEID